MQEKTGDLPFQNKSLNVLFSPKVQAELEFSQKQKIEIQKLLEEIKQTQQDFSQTLKTLNESGASKPELNRKRQEFMARLEAKKESVQVNALEILLPHQRDRLSQLTVQLMMQETAKNQKRQSGLLTEPMMKYLDIDRDQAEKIRKKTVELQDKMKEEIQQLQKKYRDELLQELTVKQREKYEKATGRFFAR